MKVRVSKQETYTVQEVLEDGTEISRSRAEQIAMQMAGEGYCVVSSQLTYRFHDVSEWHIRLELRSTVEI